MLFQPSKAFAFTKTAARSISSVLKRQLLRFVAVGGVKTQQHPLSSAATAFGVFSLSILWCAYVGQSLRYHPFRFCSIGQRHSRAIVLLFSADSLPLTPSTTARRPKNRAGGHNITIFAMAALVANGNGNALPEGTI
jgi:hypothetical protein